MIFQFCFPYSEPPNICLVIDTFFLEYHQSSFSITLPESHPVSERYNKLNKTYPIIPNPFFFLVQWFDSLSLTICNPKSMDSDSDFPKDVTMGLRYISLIVSHQLIQLFLAFLIFLAMNSVTLYHLAQAVILYR